MKPWRLSKIEGSILKVWSSSSSLAHPTLVKGGGQHLPKHMGYKLGVSYGTYITYLEIHQLQKNRREKMKQKIWGIFLPISENEKRIDKPN
jgi:hypothetical protein